MPAADPNSTGFPNERSLCERCGYPLRDLSLLSDCPECGMAVLESSPSKRTYRPDPQHLPFGAFFTTAPRVLLSPRRFFRTLSPSGCSWHAWNALGMSGILASLIWFVTGYQVIGFFGLHSLLAIVLVMQGVWLLTYIEVIGVVAFSRRRGWRVPWPLAERVCSYAAVGWLPGALIAGGGAWVLKQVAVGEPWFDSLLGLVRVAWLFYGGLFVVSFLWFETLVWIGVRQMKFANDTLEGAEPGSAQPPADPPLPPAADVE